ncbi:MAG: carboxy-S-adenosyl-L-methionine synthase CmoA [Gammaproteobacteria bacterium]
MSKKPHRDSLYAQRQDHLVDFAFDEAVARVFPDMIRRSVPGYDTLIALIGLLAARYAQPGSRCYDLGCSLGAVTLSMRRRITVPGCTLVAVDNADAMVAHCRDSVAADGAGLPVELSCADIRDVPVRQASVVVLNFTLQFIEPEHRLELLRRIHGGMLPGAALILSEKIVFDDALEQRLQDDLHRAFKRANGYSELEISQKRNALEKVLIPDTLEQHDQRLREAGFGSSHVWFQALNFASLLALK